MRRKEMT